MSDAPQQKTPPAHLGSFTRFALDMAPLAVFFIAYRNFGVMAATAAIIVVTLISLAVIYWKERTLAPMPLVTGIIVTLFGGMTLWLDNEIFIKMKPTIVNLIFASVLLGGLLLQKPLLKWVLGYAIQLEERGWYLLSLRWGLYFVFLAALNEYIWRTYSTDFWVNFKVFGMLSCTLVFTLLQVPLMQRYIIKADEEHS